MIGIANYYVGGMDIGGNVTMKIVTNACVCAALNLNPTPKEINMPNVPTHQHIPLNRPRLHLVLVSMRPGETEWSVRNRCCQSQGTGERLKKELRKLRNTWQIIEPQTMFKLKWVNWAF